MSTRIFHNPRCSKSRQTLQLLRDHEVEPEIVEYLNTPPSADELKQILQLLGIPAKDLLRKGEAIYKELNLKEQLDDELKLIQAMVEHPKLIERPIVIKGQQAVIGRPPENVLTLI